MWLVPLQVDVRHPAMDQDEIERAIAYHLVRDAQVTAARVPSLRPHAIRLGLARLSSACFPFSDGARRLQGAIEGEVDETLQNASAEWPTGQEHTQKDGCEDHLNQQVSVRLGTQNSF